MYRLCSVLLSTAEPNKPLNICTFKNGAVLFSLHELKENKEQKLKEKKIIIVKFYISALIQ